MIKDFYKYYKQVSKDYEEMRSELKDMEQELANAMVTPEQLDQMKLMIQPIKQNYEMLSYVAYLLNLPTKKQKKYRYKQQQKLLLEMSKTEEKTLLENKEALDSLKEFREEL